MKTKQIYKSAITGEIVSKKFALENPDTTYKTTVDVGEAKPIDSQLKDVDSGYGEAVYGDEWEKMKEGAK
jgi:hypothetical protein